MNHSAAITKDRAAGHDGLDAFVLRFRVAIQRPVLAALDDVGRTTLGGEVRQRPNGVELGLDRFRDVSAPSKTVPVQYLSTLTGEDVDRLGEVKLNPFAVRFEEGVRSFENKWMGNHWANLGTTCDEGTGALREFPDKVVGPHFRAFDPGRNVAVDSRQFFF